MPTPQIDPTCTALLTGTPVGTLRLSLTPRGLTRLEFYADSSGPADTVSPDNEIMQAALAELHDYFAGSRQSFSIPIDWQGMALPTGGFEERVWRAALAIPYGQTRSYGQLAQQLGQPGASRAVGVALGKNPLPIIIPCHRILGSDGHLRGYSAPDGLAKKTRLLQLEGVLFA